MPDGLTHAAEWADDDKPGAACGATGIATTVTTQPEWVTCPDCRDIRDLALLTPAQPAPDLEPDVVHTAGIVFVNRLRLRQRCAWCGAVLLDCELPEAVTRNPDGTIDSKVASWDIGRMVAVAGDRTWALDLQPGYIMPATWCGLIDPDVTGTARG